ncbi:MAG TPA: hypothetical protein VGO21_05845 [Candidatus Paceibacterota bacterium]|jgi:hypothetical protein|nr:hypothetical protein [Candidatus Paceibacterota bacterium]
MHKEGNNKNVEKLLAALLVSRGISTNTLGKIMGVDRTVISKMIPVSDIQNDIKKYAKEKR